MTPDELDAILRAVNRLRPFRPYTIEFNSGSQLPVTHPEVVSRSVDVHVFVAPDRTQHVFVAASVTKVIIPPPPS